MFESVGGNSKIEFIEFLKVFMDPLHLRVFGKKVNLLKVLQDVAFSMTVFVAVDERSEFHGRGTTVPQVANASAVICSKCDSSSLNVVIKKFCLRLT